MDSAQMPIVGVVKGAATPQVCLRIDSTAEDLEFGLTSSASRFGVAIYAFLVHALAIATFSLVVHIILTYYDFGAPAVPATESEPAKPAVASFAFGTFGTHPLLMVTAFGLLSPVATVGYKTWESLLGVPHAVAKYLHAAMQTAAMLIGVVGVASEYKSHAGILHFQTAHSWLGILAVALFVLQWLLGTLVYLNPWAPGWLRAKLMSTHIVLGTLSIMLTLITLFSGPLAMVWKPNTAGGLPTVGVTKWQLGNAASMTSALLLLSIFMVFWEARRVKLGKAQ